MCEIGNYAYSNAPRGAGLTTNNGDLCQWARRAGADDLTLCCPTFGGIKHAASRDESRPRARSLLSPRGSLLPGNRNSIKSRPHASARLYDFINSIFDMPFGIQSNRTRFLIRSRVPGVFFPSTFHFFSSCGIFWPMNARKLSRFTQ